MAFVMVSQAPSREMYQQVTDRVMAEGGAAPEGLIVHTASETADGAVKIIDVWDSQEAATAFGERLRPHIEAVMGEAAPAGPPPGAEFYEVFDLLKP